MISVLEATRRILERVQVGPHVSLPLAAAAGYVLAQDVQCTRDSPPHDKSVVDGYAVRSEDIPPAGAVLEVIEEVTAGQIPTKPVLSGGATRIMTGAPVPSGADAVVMVEHTQSHAAGQRPEQVRVLKAPARAGQNIMRQGESMRSGDTVLSRGHRLRGIELGLLAELGIPEVNVSVQPTVAVLTTGDELVEYDHTPAPGQIRNSNGPMLAQLVVEASAQPRNLGIARDDEAELERIVREGLTSDVLVLSGGVSEGVLDLVPRVLQRLGVTEVFHKVNLKPGKPLWFGVYARPARPAVLVFGLPGNPVSGLVCFHLFVRAALAGMAGQSSYRLPCYSASLAKDHFHRSDRPTYHPGRMSERHGELQVEPLTWRGSADLRTLVDADVLIHFTPGERAYVAHEPVTVYAL